MEHEKQLINSENPEATISEARPDDIGNSVGEVGDWNRESQIEAARQKISRVFGADAAVEFDGNVFRVKKTFSKLEEGGGEKDETENAGVLVAEGVVESADKQEQMSLDKLTLELGDKLVDLKALVPESFSLLIDPDSSNYFSEDGKVISLKNLSEAQGVIAFLHEVGHSKTKDGGRKFTGLDLKKMSLGVELTYNQEELSDMIERTIKDERSAWAEAQLLSRELGLSWGDEIRAESDIALRTYDDMAFLSQRGLKRSDFASNDMRKRMASEGKRQESQELLDVRLRFMRFVAKLNETVRSLGADKALAGRRLSDQVSYTYRGNKIDLRVGNANLMSASISKKGGEMVEVDFLVCSQRDATLRAWNKNYASNSDPQEEVVSLDVLSTEVKTPEQMEETKRQIDQILALLEESLDNAAIGVVRPGVPMIPVVNPVTGESLTLIDKIKFVDSGKTVAEYEGW